MNQLALEGRMMGGVVGGGSMSSRMSSACWSLVQHASRITTGSGLAGRTQREVSGSSYSF